MATIYLDYQASTPTDHRVLEKMRPYFSEHYANPHSADHVLGWAASRSVEESLANLASFLNVDSDEIVITSGATESNNHAILGCSAAAQGTRRNRIIVSSVEHKCVLESAMAARQIFGVDVVFAPVDQLGRVNLDWLEDNVDDSVILVSVIGVNNEIGTVQDFASISTIVRKVGAMFHSDCAQAPLAIDLSETTKFLDLASFSGHKMYGPKGIGALYIAREALSRVKPLIYGGGQQNNLRSGTVPTPLAVGIGEAARLLTDGEGRMERQRLSALRDQFMNCLTNTGITVHLITPVRSIPVHPGNANIRFVGTNAHELLQRLQPRVAASTGSACASGEIGVSHVLRALGMSENEAEECIRFSFGRPTDTASLEEAAIVLGETVHAMNRE